MIKILFFIMLSTSLWAGDDYYFGKFTVTAFKSIMAEEEPIWLKEYKAGTLQTDDGANLYFIGESKVVDDDETQEAIKQARENGLNKISEYIGIKINITTASQKGDNSSSFTKKSNSTSRANLSGIVPISSFIDVVGDRIKGYTYFKTSKKHLDKIKADHDKINAEYEELLSSLRRCIQSNNINKGNDLIFKIESYEQASSDVKFQKLKVALKNTFEVDMKVNKNNFSLNDYINISLKPSKTLYVYVLLEYGNSKNTKLLFPSRFDTNNYLNSTKYKKLKKLKMTKQYVSKNGNKITLYASRTPIDFVSYIETDYKLSNSVNAPWKEMLQNKIDESIVFKKDFQFNVKNKKQTKQSICLKASGNSSLLGKLSKISKKIIKKDFKIKRHCSSADYTIVFNCTEEGVSAASSSEIIRVVSYNFEVYDNQDEEIFSSDEQIERFTQKASSSKIAKYLKKNLKSDIRDIVSTIKE